jgi:hypothetical protein
VSWNLRKLSQLWRCNGGFGPRTQNAFLFPVNAMFRHDCPLVVKPASMPWRLVHKKIGEILYLLICSPSADHPGYYTAEVRNPGGTYELPCISTIFTHHLLCWQCHVRQSLHFRLLNSSFCLFVYLFLTVASLMVWAEKHISCCQQFRELRVSIRELMNIVLWLNVKSWRFYALTKRRLTIYQSARKNVPEDSYLVTSCQFHVQTIYAHITALYNSC